MISKGIRVAITVEDNTSEAIGSATIRLLKEWILSDCVKSPEEEAKLIIYIAGRTISNCK